jgi:hypothetical protein
MIEELQWALNFDTEDNDEKTKEKNIKLQEMDERTSDILE